MKLFKNLFSKKSPPAAEPSEPAQAARSALTPQAWLLELFKSHGLGATVHDGWVLPNADLPAIRGSWSPGETHGRLDVQVMVRDGVLIEECFGGIGAGDVGLADGLQNFTINSFHVLLSALWRHDDPDQVTTEAWTVGDCSFSAFIGNVGTRSSSDVTPTIPEGMMSCLEAAMRGESLGNELHWFRFYVANLNGEFTFEAVKDNERWPTGESALASCGWTPGVGFYSARLFILLRNTFDQTEASTQHATSDSCVGCHK